MAPSGLNNKLHCGSLDGVFGWIKRSRICPSCWFSKKEHSMESPVTIPFDCILLRSVPRFVIVFHKNSYVWISKIYLSCVWWWHVWDSCQTSLSTMRNDFRNMLRRWPHECSSMWPTINIPSKFQTTWRFQNELSFWLGKLDHAFIHFITKWSFCRFSMASRELFSILFAVVL